VYVLMFNNNNNNSQKRVHTRRRRRPAKITFIVYNIIHIYILMYNIIIIFNIPTTRLGGRCTDRHLVYSRFWFVQSVYLTTRRILLNVNSALYIMLIVMIVDDNNKRIIYLFVNLTYICLHRRFHDPNKSTYVL